MLFLLRSSFFLLFTSSFHSLHFIHSILSDPIPFHPITSPPSHPIPFHPVPSHPIPAQPITSHHSIPFPSHFIPSHSKPSHPILAYLRDVVSATGLSSHRKDKPGLGSPNSLESFLKNGHPMFSSGHIECFDTCLDHS